MSITEAALIIITAGFAGTALYFCRSCLSEMERISRSFVESDDMTTKSAEIVEANAPNIVPLPRRGKARSMLVFRDKAPIEKRS